MKKTDLHQFHAKKFRAIGLQFFMDHQGDISDFIFTKSATGSLASTRLQFAPALQACLSLNMETSMMSLHNAPCPIFEKARFSDICIVGKMSASRLMDVQTLINANRKAVTQLKSEGCKIITQYCDNLLHTNDILSDFYRDLLSASDCVVFPSKKLLEVTSNQIELKARRHIIKDPWQIKHYHQSRELKNTIPCRLIWFGSNRNSAYLIQQLPSMIEKSPQEMTYELTILGQPYTHTHVRNFIANSNHKNLSNWSFRLAPWDNQRQPEQLEQELTRAHFSLIPSDPNDPLKCGVSHNRVVDSIRAGCLTLASPMDSYNELSQICLLGNDFGLLLKNAIHNYVHYAGTMQQQREQVLACFSPSHNAQQWQSLIKSLVSTS